MKKSVFLVRHQPVWVCLSQQAVSFRRQALKCGRYTVRYCCIVMACITNMLAVLSIASEELNAIMPNLTGGIAQYTLAGLGHC